jgi:hypothetical protein
MSGCGCVGCEGRLPAKAIGMGAVPLPLGFAQAQTDLQNQVILVVTAGDTYLQAGETANALSAYQAAGQAGATSVGPEIDLAGMPNTTQPYTQQAWQINGFLAQTTDAPTAKQYAYSMIALYQMAIASAKNVALSAPNPAALNVTPDAATISPARVVFGTALAGLIAGFAWVHLKGPIR